MRIFDYAGLLAQGLITTIELTVISSVLACCFAGVGGLALLSKHRWIRWPTTLLVEFLRGTSCYIQLFWLYFALPLFGIYLDAFVVGALALALNIGSFGSEVVKAAIQSVAKEQTEAAIAINLTSWQQMRWVVFPQALITMLPPMNNLLIELVKVTPLVSLITITDLTFVVQIFRQQTGETVQAFGALMVVYFIISTCVALPFQLIERRLSFAV